MNASTEVGAPPVTVPTERQPPTIGLDPWHYLRLLSDATLSRAIHVAATLGVADLLRRGSRDVDALAREAACNADALYRLLRYLASAGIFDEPGPGTFALNAVAEYLRSDAPDS